MKKIYIVVASIVLLLLLVLCAYFINENIIKARQLEQQEATINKQKGEIAELKEELGKAWHSPEDKIEEIPKECDGFLYIPPPKEN